MPDIGARPTMRLQLGGVSRAELLRRLDVAGVQLNDYARTLLGHDAFEADPLRTCTIALVSVGDLVGPSGGTIPEAMLAAQHAGLEACPPTAGPWLRLAMPDQPEAPDSVLSAGRPPTSAIHVASPPLWQDADMPRGFYLRVVDGVRWLRGYRCDDDYVQPADSVFAFAVPKPTSTRHPPTTLRGR